MIHFERLRTETCWDVYFIDPVLVGSSSGLIIGLNQAAVRLFQFESKEELLGKPVNILLPESIRKAHGQWMQKYMETGQRSLLGNPRVVTALRKDEKPIQVQINLSEELSEGQTIYIAVFKPGFPFVCFVLFFDLSTY